MFVISTIFVTNMAMAEGATSNDKTINALKIQIQKLQSRIQKLENIQEVLKGETGPAGPQGPPGDVTQLKSIKITFLRVKDAAGDSCARGDFSDFLFSSTGASDFDVLTGLSSNKTSFTGGIENIYQQKKTLQTCTLYVYYKDAPR